MSSKNLKKALATSFGLIATMAAPLQVHASNVCEQMRNTMGCEPVSLLRQILNLISIG